MSKQHIADRITKMIELAESTTHPAEAETFMAKVQALLEQHGMSMLELGTLSSDDPVGCSKDVGTYNNMESSYRDVAFEVAEYYGCEATVGKRYVSKPNTKKGYVFHNAVTVYGRESARITFTLMWPYIKKSISRAARELSKQNGELIAKNMRWVADALTHRVAYINLQKKKDNQKLKVNTTGVNALVPVDLIKQAMPDDLKTVRERNWETTSGARKAAGDINLDAQVAKQSGTVKRIAK